MCGIWGFLDNRMTFTPKQKMQIIKHLFLLSETRGKDASGIAFASDNMLHIVKGNVRAGELVASSKYQKTMKECFADCQKGMFAAVGHSRLVTDGAAYHDCNNQPVCYGNIITVHNGIIVNSESLWKENPDLKKESEVDTEVFVKLVKKHTEEGLTPDEAVLATYREIQGMASTLNFFGDSGILVAASNNGSLYYMTSKDDEAVLFASERLILEALFKADKQVQNRFELSSICQIRAGQFAKYKLRDPQRERTMVYQSLTKEPKRPSIPINVISNRISSYEPDYDKILKIRRCTKCLLPETMPYIEFDGEGVCNYCKTYKKMTYKSPAELSAWADSKRKRNGEVDSIVSFSGGRDSSYGLHYFIKELSLHPIAYSYDWGMVTDLARRNQSRMCSELGVELILISADIKQKRENIRKNVAAWLKRPDLGMVPLFMAGDKHFMYYANQVRKEYGLDTVLMAANPFEKTHFKSGFCEAKPPILKTQNAMLEVEQLDVSGILKMSGHYAGQFIKNPAYFNSSVFDTIGAAVSYYAIPHNYFRLFNYIEWNETEIDRVLREQYDWETATDTESTWRIGDGTAPFYNYIYYCVCGFTENDTLRSNQIREGMISREEALKLTERDNRVRWESLKWYFDTIGLDMYEALAVVQKMPKLYD